MGDFSAASSSLCLSSSSSSVLGSSATGSVTGHSGVTGSSTPPAGGIPKHSTVVERLRQRIEGCRRHHASCESRYQQAQPEQLELERRDTASLYHRSLEQRAKKAPTAKHGHAPDIEASTGTEHRSHTLIMLQEAVQKKLEGARSPLNGEQQNGICDGRYSPSAKRRRKDLSGMDTLNNIPNMPLPSVSPIHQLDIKPHLPSVTHSGGLEDINKNGGQQDVKLAVNGSSELEDSFNILNKEMKQEPLDDVSVIDTSDTSLSNQNKLFSDINLNDQEWQELIDELANTVPEDDIQDLFNEDFEEKKDLDFSRPTAQTPLPQESASVKSDPSHSPFPHVSMGSPQVRPSSSGPSFSNVSSVSSIPSVSSAPSTLMLASSPASCVVQSPQTPNPPLTPGQTSTRPGNGYVMTPTSTSGNGSVNLPSADLSPAEQLKQMAAQQQQRVKLIQQKQQHQQQQHPNQPSNWSPVGPPSSPYGGTYGTEKPSSPMMYPQNFNNQNPAVPPMGNNPPKTTMNNYLPQNPMNMINQQASNLNSNSISKTSNMLNYGNTKPLSHFSAEMSQRMTPPIANQNKNAMLPYMQQQQPQTQQPSMPPQMSHLSEEQKRMLIMKQKGLMSQQMGYGSLPSHSQEQNPVGMSRPSGPMQQSVPGSPANPGGGPAFMPNQPQAAVMKQMLIEQRAQLHAMEQQKQHFLREQRQQQQILAEQQLQQPHMNRQHLQQQRNPYGVQQVSQFQGSPQDIAVARNQAALQSIRASRMMAQNASIMSMGPSQNPGAMPTGPLQPEMGMAPYSNTSSSQPGMYSMNAGVNQMMQHPNQSSLNLGHGAVQGPRPPNSGQALGMVGGFGQNMLVNSVMPQHQQIKGHVGQAMPRSQAPRLQNMMPSLPQGAQNWSQRGLQGMRTSGDMAAYNNGSVYPMQSGQSRMSKHHFQQGMGQSVIDNTGAVRALNPGIGRQMMPSLPGQQGTTQPRQMMPGMNPGVPNMSSFNQAPPHQLPSANFAQSNQNQTYDRNPSQDMSYSYTDASTGPFPGLADGADLVDSIMSRGPGDEWMQELDELFGNQ